MKKVLITVLEGRAVTRTLSDHYPEGMSDERPIATLTDVDGKGAVYILCKPVNQVTIDGSTEVL